MFTQRGQGAGKPLLANAEVTLGEYGHTSGTVGLRGEQNGFDYQVNLSRVTEHGISATNAKDVFSYHPDRDGLQQTAAQVALGYALNADWRIEGQWLQSQGKAWVMMAPAPKILTPTCAPKWAGSRSKANFCRSGQPPCRSVNRPTSS